MHWYEILIVCAIVCVTAVPIIYRSRRRNGAISVTKRQSGATGRSKEV